MLFLIYYAALWNPMNSAQHTAVATYKVTSPQANISSILQNMVAYPKEGLVLNAVLMVPVSTEI